MENRNINPSAGAPMLILAILLTLLCPVGWIFGSASLTGSAQTGVIIASTILFVLVMFLWPGFVVVEPNGARVLLLFGTYKGSIVQSGFFWVNPFFTKYKLSLRAMTLNGDKLKVNDKAGNPVEIAAVIIWQVVDTYKAKFEVDSYSDYIRLQSETAIRHVAGAYSYDSDDGSTSLMHNSNEVLEQLRSEVQERVNRAGLTILEARLAHLAYAPEIAGVMLKKQQASAIIAARQRIVDGAVGMVEIALKQLDESGTVKLDDERKASMISNLMVVLCSETNVQPVVNTGSLYS